VIRHAFDSAILKPSRRSCGWQAGHKLCVVAFLAAHRRPGRFLVREREAVHFIDLFLRQAERHQQVVLVRPTAPPELGPDPVVEAVDPTGRAMPSPIESAEEETRLVKG
jgi:hypothetical protein